MRPVPLIAAAPLIAVPYRMEADALGIVIVAAVLFFFMGFRLGVVVALVVPLVTFAAIALFAAGAVLAYLAGQASQKRLAAETAAA